MILYFSGTGNSEYIARRIAKATGDELLSLNERIRNGNAAAVRAERLVFVTPTYGWRIPRLVEKWIDETEFSRDDVPAWFIMSCGSEIGGAAKHNARLCQRKGLALFQCCSCQAFHFIRRTALFFPFQLFPAEL